MTSIWDAISKPSVGGKIQVTPNKSVLDIVKGSITPQLNPIFGPLTPAKDAAVDYLGKNENFQRFAGQMGTSGSVGFEGMNQAAQGRTFTEAQQADVNATNSSPAGGGPGGLVTVPLYAADQAWSYGVARPAATAALLADSPGQHSLGEAWDRSETVSFGRAVQGNPLTAGTLAKLIGGSDQYDPWSDTSMQAADQNPYYNFLTGATDTALQFAVPMGIKAARMQGIIRSGLTNTVRNAEQMGVARGDYLAHKAARDPEFWAANPDIVPRTTEWGTYVDMAAKETRAGRLMENPMVGNSTGMDKYDMVEILQRTNDPDTVNEIFLANMGDLTAVKNIADAAPDHIWTLAGMRPALIQAMNNGIPFRPLGADATRVTQVFDTALQRDTYFTDLKNLLMTDKGGEGLGMKMGSTWIPSRGSDGRLSRVTRPAAAIIERTRNAKGEMK